MAGQLKIHVDLVQLANIPFTCRVEIINGSGNDQVTVRLRETAGVAPLFMDTGTTVLTAGGGGSVPFQLSLAGPCTARLLAEEVTSAVPLHFDDAHIEVT